MRTIHKVEFLYPGVMFDESETRVVKTQDPSKVVVPQNAFAFRFFDVTEQDAKLEDGRVITHTETKDDDKTYYPDARVMTKADVKREVADNRILLSNMEGNGFKKVIKTRMGNFKPYIDGETIVF